MFKCWHWIVKHQIAHQPIIYVLDTPGVLVLSSKYPWHRDRTEAGSRKYHPLGNNFSLVSHEIFYTRCVNVYTQLPASLFSFICAYLAWKITVVNQKKKKKKQVSLQSLFREAIEHSTWADLVTTNQLDSASAILVKA